MPQLSCAREDVDRDRAEKPPGCNRQPRRRLTAPGVSTQEGNLRQWASDEVGRCGRRGQRKRRARGGWEPERACVSPWQSKPNDGDDEQPSARCGGSIFKVIAEDVKPDEGEQDDEDDEDEWPHPAPLERASECATKPNHSGAS
jgi:hypothetical protein